MRKFSLIFTVGFMVFAAFAIVAQTPDGAVKNSLVPGDVISISDKVLVLKTKDAQLSVELSEKTEYKRVPAERPNLAAATAAALADIVVGDKVIVSGLFGEDKTKLPARTIYLMAKSDIAQKSAKDADRWTTKAISGKVTSVNLAAKQVGVEIRGLMGSTTTTMVTAKDGAIFKRYAPNSVKYSEALTSTLLDVKPGDMLRATGDKSADGLSFAAEEIITGAFQTVAGTVKSIDAAKNEIVITNLQTNKDTTVALGTASTMKKFPEEFAQRMVQFQGGQSGAARPAGGAVGQRGGDGQPGGPGGRMMIGGARSIDEMLERFPTITATDLKVGDMVAISSSKDGALDRINAIKLLAGVEPFIRATQASGNMQRGGQQGSFNIPGLDGFDMP